MDSQAGDNVDIRVEETTSATELTDELEEVQDGVDDADRIARRVRPRPKPAQPDIMERFARSQGFEQEGANRFFRADGSWIAKANGAVFPWEQRTAAGKIVRYYLPKDHCLEREPLQLEADVWGLIERFPERYALILSNLHGGPVEISGARLCAMRDSGELTLYPATYRLVYGDDCDS
jgi:hypothetical protein